MNNHTKVKKAFKLLQESIINPGSYTPTAVFLVSNNVAIALDGKPIILLGWHDDDNSHAIAERLLSSPDFATLIAYEYGTSDKLSKVISTNNDVCKNQEYTCITESKQGVDEYGQTQGKLVAVLPQNNAVLAFAICTNNKLMQCFYPQATPLSAQLVLDAA